MADFVSTALAAIEANLLNLYTMKYESLSQKDRTMRIARIAELESSRDKLISERDRWSGARPVCATIDLQTPAAVAEEE